MIKISLMVLFFAVATYQAALSAFVNGTIDCSAASFCYVKGMKIFGDIDDQTVAQFAKLLDQLHKRAEREKKQIHFYSVELDSHGGSVPAAFALGRLLRKENISATVLSSHGDQECISACVLIFAGAVHREFNANGRIGIHRPYLGVPPGEVSPDKMRDVYLQMLQGVRAYLKEMNVSEQLADAMFRIDPEKVVYLDYKAAAFYGLTQWDPVYKELSDISEAKQFRLNRTEFMERKSRALRCPYNIDAPEAFRRCYDGVMTNTRPAPSRPPSDGIDYSRYGEAVDVDWSRLPLR